MFKLHSDTFLSGLSYCLTEVNYNRGHIVYKQDLDQANYLYMVKQGNFLTIKTLHGKSVKPLDKILDIYNQKKCKK